MSKVKVALADNIKRVIAIDPEATNGATLGVNLRDGSGRVIRASEVLNSANTGNAGGSTAVGTIWRLIREVPSNIQALAALAGAGFVARTSSEQWVQRMLRAEDGVELDNGNGAGGDPTMRLADLADTGIGTALQKITRDAKGRVEGTSAATTDDLAEGAGNLYHTEARALEATTAVLSGTGDVPLEFDGDEIRAKLSDPVVAAIPSEGAPADASAPGEAGTVLWDADYLYVCVATDVWKRVPLATW